MRTAQLQPMCCIAAILDLQGPAMPPPGFKAGQKAAAAPAAAPKPGSNVHAAAAARVAASIAILTSHRAVTDADGQDGMGQQRQQQQQDGGDAEESGGWLPPADQAGDGTTSLNAKYGY